MGKTDELLRNAGGSIAQSASFRPAPAAMPAMASSVRVSDPRRDGLDRSKDFWLVPLDRIDCDRDQPREGGFDKEIDEGTGLERINPEFQRLVDSLERDGLLQPITLVHAAQPGRFRVHIGERRFRAASLLGWEKIPARVIEPAADLEPGELLARQVIENVIRSDLKPIEQARSFRTLLDVHGWSFAKLGKALGYSTGFISQRLKLLELPESVQARVENGELDAMRGYHVSQIADPAAQVEIVERIVSGDLNREQTLEVVRQVVEKEKASRSRAGASKGKGRGASKGKGKLPTERSVKAPSGLKVTVAGRKGFDVLAWIEAMEFAIGEARAKLEPAEEQDAA
jgi:ParB family transcriptional regulator, chromosome partitioning protein